MDTTNKNMLSSSVATQLAERCRQQLHELWKTVLGNEPRVEGLFLQPGVKWAEKRWDSENSAAPGETA